jgi:hypothetical protein
MIVLDMAFLPPKYPKNKNRRKLRIVSGQFFVILVGVFQKNIPRYEKVV